MSKFLDITGLNTLWAKIKSYVAVEVSTLQTTIEDNEKVTAAAFNNLEERKQNMLTEADKQAIADLHKDPSVPTKTSELTNDSDFISDTKYVHTDNNYTSADKAEVAKIADKAEKNVVDAISEKIPAQASADNQLADKNFVNSSITTATATFKGTFTDLEALKATEADANDYAFYNYKDDAGNDKYDKYTYVAGEGWKYAYGFNNAGFTASQWESINSGLTSSDKNAIANAVSVLEQSLTDKQKEQARNNIDAVSKEDALKTADKNALVQSLNDGASEESFRSRRTAGTLDIKNGLAYVQKVKGTTAIINQLCTNGDFHDKSFFRMVNGNWSVDGNVATINPSADYARLYVSDFALPAGHIIYMSCEILQTTALKINALMMTSGSNARAVTTDGTINEWKQYSLLTQVGSTGLANMYFCDSQKVDTEKEYAARYIRNVRIIDATKVMETLSTILDSDKENFESLYGSIITNAYNAGSLLHFNAKSIISKNSSGVQIASFDCDPSKILDANGNAFFEGGMKSIGNDFDEFGENYAIRRIGTRAYQSGDEDDASVKTDLTNTIYVLDEPVYISLSTRNMTYSAENEGTENISEEESTPIDMLVSYKAEEWTTIVKEITDNAVQQVVFNCDKDATEILFDIVIAYGQSVATYFWLTTYTGGATSNNALCFARPYINANTTYFRISGRTVKIGDGAYSTAAVYGSGNTPDDIAMVSGHYWGNPVTSLCPDFSKITFGFSSANYPYLGVGSKIILKYKK